MGYWEEKGRYEYCGVCGIHLINKNRKGICVSCKEAVCKKCGKIKNEKIYCKDCLEGKKLDFITKLINRPFVIINENLRINQLPKEKREKAREELKEKIKKGYI